MEEQIDRLKQQIESLRRRLIWVEVEKVRVSCDEWELELRTVEHNQCSLRLAVLDVESGVLQARLTAALSRLAQLEVEAEVKRLLSQPSLLAGDFREHCDRIGKVLEKHERVARRMIRDATDEQLVDARCNGEDLAPIREARRLRRERQRERKRLQAELEQKAKLKQDGPSQRYRGPRP